MTGPLYPQALDDVLVVEGGDPTAGEDEVLAAWGRIINSGLVAHLQGSYQRTAAWLVEHGLVTLERGGAA